MWPNRNYIFCLLSLQLRFFLRMRMGDERNCVLSFWNVEIDIDFLPSRPKQCLSIQFLSMSIFLLENPMGLRSWINDWLIGQIHKHTNENTKIHKYSLALQEIPYTDLLISFIDLRQIYFLDQHCQQPMHYGKVSMGGVTFRNSNF